MQFVRVFRAEHFALFSRIRGLGFDFIELLVPEPGDLDLSDTRKALADADLGVVLAARVNLQRNLCSTEAASRQSGIEYLKYAVDCAAALGAEIVGGPLYGSPLVYAGRAPAPVSEDERMARLERCATGLNLAAEHAAASRVRLAVEPLNRFETDAASNVGQALELLERVHPSVGLLLDTFHMSMEEASIPAAIRRAGSRLLHFQANENHRGFLGTGSVNWVEVARALDGIAYSGPISLEPFCRRTERFGVPVAAWRPPDENEDEPLRAGVQFLKSSLALAKHRR